MRTIAQAAAVAAAALWIAGCAEVAQEPGKSYAGKEDAKPYASDLFKGDKAKWEGALAERSLKQNEYVRMQANKK